MDARQGCRRVGLFGGTFNPIHRGHLKVVRDVKDAFGLDFLYVIPSALPPHKSVVGVAAAAERFEMARRAFEGLEGFSVSDIEIKRAGPSYTIDTIRAFKAKLPEAVEIFLLIGIDAFLELHTWFAYESLLKEVPLVVMSRPCGLAGSLREAIGKYLHEYVSHRYTYSDTGSCFTATASLPVYPINVSSIDISSTEIREKITQDQSIADLVPEQVMKYIQDKRLYQ